MKQKLLLITALLVALALPRTTLAYDFSAVAPSGQTLYYNISNGTAVVTYPGLSENNPYSGYTEPMGTLVIPDTVEYNGNLYPVSSIGRSAFRGCADLTSVSIPNSITSIGDWVFSLCTELTSVTIPNSVTNIGGYAFQYCTSLTSVSIPNSVTNIGWAAFEACSSLTSISIPNSVTCIDGFVFTLCTGLTSVSIPNSVTIIRRGAFRGCTNLTSVSIPSSITNIGDSAFRGCTSLTSIYCNANNPPSIYSYVFDGSYCNIFVPYGSVNSYKNAAGWSGYSLRIFGMPDLDFAYIFASNNDTMGTVSVGVPDCDSNITVMALANTGYQFNSWSDGSTENPRTFHLTGDITITALFGYRTYTVVGQPSDASRGTVTGNATVDYLDSVTLSATANYGYHFDHWSDGGTDNPRLIVATSNINLLAFFHKNQYTLVTTVNDTLRGSVISNGGGINIDYSDLSLNYFTQMTADSVAPAGDNYFRYVLTTHITNDTNWFCFYTFENADGSMVWQFAPSHTGTTAMGYHSLSSNNSNLFTNTAIGNTIVYSDLQGVSITYSNLGWIIEFPVDVHCTHRQTNASYTSVYWGHMSNSNGDTLYADYLSEVSIEAIPNHGYHFSQWSDGDSNASRYITVEGDTTLTAYFEINSYQLTVLPNDETLGTVTGGGTYTHGTQVTITATPSQGNRFDRWSDGTLFANYTFTLADDQQLVAVFVPVDTVHVHDTTLVTIHDTLRIVDTVRYNYFQYDTTIVNVYQYDTTIVNNGTFSFDTSIFNSYVYDTTLVFDTMIVNIYTYDTSIYNNYQYDTVIINIYQYDTTLVSVFDTVINNLYQFDTTIINTTVYYHDTVFVNNYVHDTMIAYVNQYVHDTTYINNYVHDTTIITHTQYDTTFVYTTLHDTAYLTAYIHDTAFVNNYVHDTVWLTQTVWEYIHDTVFQYVNQYIHDTTFINNYIHDTVTQYVNQYVHDTTFINNYIHDTVYNYINNYIHDTTFVNNYVLDTLWLTQYLYDTNSMPGAMLEYITNYIDSLMHDSTYINEHMLDSLIAYIDNYLPDTVTVIDTLYEYITLHDTVYIHDTIYVPQEGIDDVATANIRLYQRNGSIVVEDADDGMLPEVRVYDAVGRLMNGKMKVESGKVELPVPASGVYLVKIGERPARRVVVIR